MSNQPPNIKEWINNVLAANSRASASDPAGKSQPASNERSDGSYDGPESPAIAPAAAPEITSYTGLATVKFGKCWLCPRCALPKSGIMEEIAGFKNFGYSEIEICPSHLQVLYSKEGDYRECLFFRNPSGVTRCMNAIDSVRCEFDREKYEGFRRQDLEKHWDFGTPDGFIMGYCGGCMYFVEDASEIPELWSFVSAVETDQQETDQQQPEKRKYVSCNLHPYTGAPTEVFGKALSWLGDENSITCNTKTIDGGICEWKYGDIPKKIKATIIGGEVDLAEEYLYPSATDVLVLPEEFDTRDFSTESGST